MTKGMTDPEHDCSTSQPGETLANWNRRTHGGMAHVEPGSCPTCIAAAEGVAPADRAEWVEGWIASYEV